MKHLLYTLLLLPGLHSFSQVKKVELYDLIRKLVQDSTGYETVGEWGLGKPSMYPVAWQADRIEMSNDEKINFFRQGVANVLVRGVEYTSGNKPLKWNVLLKGARSGFSSFSISSGNNTDIRANTQIDSLFGGRAYRYTVLKECNGKATAGFNYYQVKIPKKVAAWLKISWQCNGGVCNMIIDGYDDWSKQYADIACPQ